MQVSGAVSPGTVSLHYVKKLSLEKLELETLVEICVFAVGWENGKLTIEIMSFSLVKRLADILYDPAEEGGYVDPDEVKKILKVYRGQSTLMSDDSVTGLCLLGKRENY